jgi:hypothetical protein
MAFELIEQSTPTATEIVEGGPVCVLVTGKTLTEKKIGVVSNATVAAQAFLVAQKGKVGKVAREGLALHGEAMIARRVRNGDYRPLAEAIAALTGETLTISSRASFETLEDRFSDKLADLKNGGYTVSKKDGVSKPGSKRVAYMQAVALIKEVRSIAAAM